MIRWRVLLGRRESRSENLKQITALVAGAVFGFVGFLFIKIIPLFSANKGIILLDLSRN